MHNKVAAHLEQARQAMLSARGNTDKFEDIIIAISGEIQTILMDELLSDDDL
jgi:hypothetical protein